MKYWKIAVPMMGTTYISQLCLTFFGGGYFQIQVKYQ